MIGKVDGELLEKEGIGKMEEGRQVREGERR